MKSTGDWNTTDQNSAPRMNQTTFMRES
jgi:hypothetical protein